jgi:Kef-type K+ transport system membrane component KefB
MAKSEVVLTAYLAGLVVARVFPNDRALVNRMVRSRLRMLTPFYFIMAGLYVSLPALASMAGLVVVVLAIKMLTKFIGTRPLNYGFGIPSRQQMHTPQC